jgi:hypothetical protein
VYLTAHRRSDCGGGFVPWSFRIHRPHRGQPRVNWNCGEIRIVCPSWGYAVKAIKAARSGDETLLNDAANYKPWW